MSNKNDVEIFNISQFQEDISYNIPFLYGPAHFLTIEEDIKNDELEEYFKTIPSHGICKRMYFGNEINVEDTFKLIKDKTNIIFELMFKDNVGLAPSGHKKHVILFKQKGLDSPVYAYDIEYFNEKTIKLSLGFHKKPIKLYGEKIITAMNDGFMAYVKIPLSGLEFDIDKLQFNIIRIDWGRSPLTSYFPIGNGFFIEDESRSVDITLLMGEQARFSDICFVKKLNDNKSFINLRTVGFNERQIIINTDLKNMEYQLVWITPKGKKTVIEYSLSIRTDEIILHFKNPYPSEEGIYGIHLINQDTDRIFYVERRDLIKHFDTKKDIGYTENINFNKLRSKKEKDNVYSKSTVDYNPSNSASYLSSINTKDPVDMTCINERSKQILEIVPLYSGIDNSCDPRYPQLCPYDLFEYHFENPHKIQSKKTRDLYPSVDFKEDKFYEFKNRNGKSIRYPYFQHENGTICNLTPALWSMQKRYVCKVLPEIAAEDIAGATYILGKLCKCYENYAPYSDYYHVKYPMSITLGPPFPYFGGFWSRWFYMDLPYVAGVAEAYAQIRKTDALVKFFNETGRNLEAEILDLIEEAIDFVFSYGIQNSNMDFVIWEGLIRIGKALCRPDYIHMALERIKIFVKDNYLFDGFWKEVTLSYHNQITQGLLKTLRLLQKYSDPKGYTYPGNGKRIDNFEFADMYPILRDAENMRRILQFPNGKHIAVQDTRASVAENPERGLHASIYLPAAKIAKITEKSKENNIQCVLINQPKLGHVHWDSLNLSLYAYGLEMLPDLGYTHTYNRSWAKSTLGHNTVIVDGQDSDKNKNGGSMSGFIIDTEFVQIIRATDDRCYLQTEIYDREVLMVQKSGDAQCYIIDLFRVKGGNRHEYALNLCADFNTDTLGNHKWIEHSETMLPEGVSWQKPKDEIYSGNASGHYHAYMFVQDVKTAYCNDESYKFEVKLVEEPHIGKGLNIIGTGFTRRINLGKAPSIRLTRQNNDNDSNDTTDDYLMDKLILRREGENLDSVFVHLFEPYKNESDIFVKSIERLSLQGLNEFDVVLKIISEDFTDYIFSAYNEDIKVLTDEIGFEGQFGFVRLQEDNIFIQTVAGKVTYKKSITTDGDNSVSGSITNVLCKDSGDDYNGFIVDKTVECDLCGKFIIVKHPDHITNAYKIEKIKNLVDKTLIDIGDMRPGFILTEDDFSIMTHIPFVLRKGPIGFKISDVKSLTAKLA